MIRYEAVTRDYGPPFRRVRALDALDLRVERGECVGVVGPNGAGKSTLLSLALGRIRASAGGVRIEGRSPRSWVRRHGAAWLPERFMLPGRWRVGAALRRFALLEGLPRREAARRVEAAMERTGLRERAGSRIRSLSRGTLQRLGLAQLLLRDRSLWVLDEPTAGLDPVWRIRFREIVEERRRRSPALTVLLASHDLRGVELLADRAILLREGRARALGGAQSGGAESDGGGTDGGGWRLRTAGSVDPTTHLPLTGRSGEVWTSAPISAAELRAPLARYLGAGGLLLELRPGRVGLEEEVRRALAGAPSPERGP